jgi:predicted exporter
MMSQLLRIFFVITVIGVAVFYIFGAQHIRIETNLNDLNPTKVSDQGLKFATDTLSQDISHRFIVVIKSQNRSAVVNAVQQMQSQLSKIDNFLVISNESIQSTYLSAVSPYRFNLLSDTQRQRLIQSDIYKLANDATRKLYQLGDGVRLIPFEEDPLGWFSDYLLTSFGNLSFAQENPNQTTLSEHDSAIPFESFSVAITQYPENMAQQQNLYQSIKNIESQISEEFQVTILHSGMFFFVVDSAESAKADIQLIAIGSIAGVLILMLLVFRSLLPLFLSLSSIAIGVSFGVLVSTLVFGSIHILTIVFGASLIGIVVDYSLHYFYHFLSREHPTEHSIEHTKTLQRAMMLSVITSLIGYGALGLSDLTILKKVALFSCSGLVMAWLSVIILGPWVTRRPIIARQALLKSIIGNSQKVFAGYPRVLISFGLILACVGGIFLSTNTVNINDDPRKFFNVSPALLAQEQQVASLTEVYEPARYLVVRGQTSEQIFQTLDVFYSELGAESQSVASALDWIPAPSTQNQDYALQNKLYMEDGATDVFFKRLGLSTSQSNTIKTAYIDSKNRSLDFPTLMKILPSLPPLWVEYDSGIFSFVLIRKNTNLERIELASQNIPNIHYVNTLADATEGLKAQRVIGSKLLVLAYGLIALMLALYYRTLSAVLLLLIPLVASVITLSAVSALGQPITVFHIMALFLVLGLGMDYIIFAKEMTNQQAITQQAILLSAVTSLLSFGLLAFSSMPIVQAFGSTILIGNSINFIAAISLFNKPQVILEKKPNVE